MPMPRVRALAPTLAALAALAPVAGCTGSGGGEAPAPSGPAATPPQPPRTDRPSADPRSPAPAGAVTAAQLPRPEDIVWSSPGAWTAGETTEGSPERPIAACQRSRFESTGATAVWTRRYTGPGGATGGAAVLSLPSPELAQQAMDTLDEWWRTCPEALAATGGAPARLAVPTTPVEIPGGRGQLTEVRWRADGAPATESQGVAVIGDRLVLLVLRSPTDGQGSAADLPMARSLPRAAERLRG